MSVLVFRSGRIFLLRKSSWSRRPRRRKRHERRERRRSRRGERKRGRKKLLNKV